ncbi:MAG: hypothetical protein LBU12_03865, partial [Deltaproteobacteria bacterium]|nr:hypothetical protein [Deltaproteobacteria bacterium]
GGRQASEVLGKKIKIKRQGALQPSEVSDQLFVGVPPGNQIGMDKILDHPGGRVNRKPAAEVRSQARAGLGRPRPEDDGPEARLCADFLVGFRLGLWLGLCPDLKPETSLEKALAAWPELCYHRKPRTGQRFTGPSPLWNRL